jgi:hypothetical protein
MVFGSCSLVMDPVDVVEQRISFLEEKIFGKNKPNDNAVPVRLLLFSYDFAIASLHKKRF